MKAIILFISMFLVLSCQQPTKQREYHPLEKESGYAYQDEDLLWHLFIYNELTGLYDYSTTSSAPYYSPETVSFDPSAETVSNFDQAVENGMTETTGEDTGGFDEGADSATEADSGMGEDSGSDTGGSDSGSDGGGSDGGGGDGGGGGE